MQHGSSKEKDREEEAGPQDRGGEEVVSEEDGQRPPQEEIDLQRRGARPRASFIFPSKTTYCFIAADVLDGRDCIRVTAWSDDAASPLTSQINERPAAAPSCFFDGRPHLAPARCSKRNRSEQTCDGFAKVSSRRHWRSRGKTLAGGSLSVVAGDRAARPLAGGSPWRQMSG